MQVLLCKESLDHGLIAFKILCNQFPGILVGVVFRLDMILAVQDEGLEIERCFQCAVAQTNGLHGPTAQLLVGKHESVPCEHRVGLKP